MALGQAIHPLDSPIATILSNKELLTAGQTALLQTVLPKILAGPRKPQSEGSDVETYLETLVSLMNRLNAQAGASEDIGELRQSMAAIERVIALIVKLKEQIDADRRFRLLQESIVESLEAVSDDAKARFFQVWETKISASER